jgi:hypothetical protein
MPENDGMSGLQKLDDPALLVQRAKVRELMEATPGESAEALSLIREYADLNAEFYRRAHAKWARPAEVPSTPKPPTASERLKGTTMEKGAGYKPGLFGFERTYLEKLRMAAQVILEAAPDSDLVCDGLEAELEIFKDRVEFALLIPGHAPGSLPWRETAGDVSGETSRQDE